MTDKNANSKHPSRLKSLSENSLFMDALANVKNSPDEEWDIKIMELQETWGLTGEYHETLRRYIESNDKEFDYSLGDNGLRVIDYTTRKAYPSRSPDTEFRIMETSSRAREGVFIKIPSDVNQKDIVDFIRLNYKEISESLDRIYPNRVKTQYPELLPKRNAAIYKMRQAGSSFSQIAKELDCEEAYARKIYKDLVTKLNPDN